MKETLSRQKLAESTKRSRVTALIAKLKSRQEFVPPVGPIIDRIHIEPLHLKNNACALAHRYLLDEVIALSCLSSSVKSFCELASSSPLVKYVTIMKAKCHLSRLGKKIVKWFNETQANSKNFDYRFTGRESRFFLHNFMYLIDAVEPSAKPGSKSHLRCMYLPISALPCEIVSPCSVELQSLKKIW